MKIDIDERVYLKSKVLDSVDSVKHCFTTKCGGVSSGKISGLNLGFRCGDNPDSVTENYRLVAKDMGFPFERITAGRQTHSANIRIITNEDAGKGVNRESEMQDIDGLVTDVANLPLVVFYADCVPILLADEKAGVIAAVHSGWRGTVSEIAGKAVEIMKNEFSSRPENIKAAIGPSIGKCCFETGWEVASQFDAALVEENDDGKFFVDLWEANKMILKKSGIKEENIDVLEICTVCNSDMLYSYRVHKDDTGRMGAFIMLEK
ncbi:MAG: peptidoglycan editing factor PgeF [Clostridia bacterium]|nr:peptidoglycan editing factor PgeF [Clostridia bacterium]